MRGFISTEILILMRGSKGPAIPRMVGQDLAKGLQPGPYYWMNGKPVFGEPKGDLALNNMEIQREKTFRGGF